MKAEHCKNMQDIRQEIDAIDEEIITLIAKRADYVKAAAKFKTNDAAVRAPDRVQKMLASRRALASAKDLDPDLIENLYRMMVEHFIEQELKHWKKAN